MLPNFVQCIVASCLTSISLYIGICFAQTDDGYFDISPGIDVQPVVPDLGVVAAMPESTEDGVFQCLSRCLKTDGCWAVKVMPVSPLGTVSLHCLYYTMGHPPSNLTQDTASKLALRRWNQGFSATERLTGICGLHLLTGESLVPDENFNCSSWVYDTDGWVYHVAKYGRFNNTDRGAGAWCASEEIAEPEWIQVFLGRVRLVTGLVTQGRHKDDSYYWVTSYRIAYSNNGADWTNYTEGGVTKIFPGNEDSFTPVAHSLEHPVFVAYVRIYPLSRSGWTCLRFDVLGC